MLGAIAPGAGSEVSEVGVGLLGWIWEIPAFPMCVYKMCQFHRSLMVRPWEPEEKEHCFPTLEVVLFHGRVKGNKYRSLNERASCLNLKSKYYLAWHQTVSHRKQQPQGICRTLVCKWDFGNSRLTAGEKSCTCLVLFPALAYFPPWDKSVNFTEFCRYSNTVNYFVTLLHQPSSH